MTLVKNRFSKKILTYAIYIVMKPQFYSLINALNMTNWEKSPGNMNFLEIGASKSSRSLV